MDSMLLVGAEDVSRAGHNISSAAHEINRAANLISESVSRFEQATQNLILALETLDGTRKTTS